MTEKKAELQRGLEARHIELIALGGTIGVGLFMGAASTLKWAGPSVLLAYIIAGLFVFFIMRSMGEMLFLEPVTGSFAVYAHRYMSPFFGYLTAWSYWFMWMAVGISEITAIGVYVQFWFPEMAQWIPALIAVGLVALANLAAVRLYGEIEFWFAMIKVTTIIVMIVVGLGVIFFGFGNGGHSIGFGNLTEHGGFFAGGWKGFLTALCIVVASYQGVELIGITAGEAKNPQVTLRSAVGKVLWRILIFYVGAIFVIVTIFPWDQIGSNGSPFVLTFAKIGITAAAGIINFVVLTAALSGCNSGMYSCGRMLYALAKNRQLPAAIGKVSRNGVPSVGVALSILILLVGSCLNYIIPNPQRVFVYVYSASVLPGMVPWFVILISQLRFRRVHQAAIASHPFRSLLFPWANYFTMAFLICVLVGMGLNDETRMSLFVGIPTALTQAGLAVEHNWTIYLPVVLIAFLVMAPAIIVAETRNQLKPVFLAAIALMALAQWGFTFEHSTLTALTLGLGVYFVAFNILEASQPSLVSKLAPAAAKGTAMGVYATLQSLGAFVGGAAGGWLLHHGGLTPLFAFSASLVVLWFFSALGMKPPLPVKSAIYHIGETWEGDAAALSARLAMLPGVIEAVVMKEERVALLKVMREGWDEAAVKQIISETN